MIELKFPTNRDFIFLPPLAIAFYAFISPKVKLLQEQISAQKRKLNETANKVRRDSIKAPHTLYLLL